MTRYLVRSHNWGDDPFYVPNLSVDGSGPVKTGILDPHGDPIYRAAEPVGFVTEFRPRIRVKAIYSAS
jgi:hypothetical protein